jgi:hypothetical protein
MARKVGRPKGSKNSGTITLRYTINGAKFKMHYSPIHHAIASERVRVLRQFGVKVKVKGWPKRIITMVEPLEAE